MGVRTRGDRETGNREDEPQRLQGNQETSPDQNKQVPAAPGHVLWAGPWLTEWVLLLSKDDSEKPFSSFHRQAPRQRPHVGAPHTPEGATSAWAQLRNKGAIGAPAPGTARWIPSSPSLRSHLGAEHRPGRNWEGLSPTGWLLFHVQLGTCSRSREGHGRTRGKGKSPEPQPAYVGHAFPNI